MEGSFADAGMIVLNISLFLATTTSVQLVEALRQLRVPKTFVQTIDITLKYGYILGKHLQQQIECVQLRTVGQKVNLNLFGSLSVSCTYPQKPYKEVYEAMILRRLRHGYKAQRSLPLEEGKTSFSYWNWQFSRPSRSYLARKEKYMIRIQDGNYHYTRGDWNPWYSTPDQGANRWPWWVPNGAGKSTLFKILVGLLPLSSGQYHFKDWTIDHELLERSPSCWAALPAGWTHFQNNDTQLFNTSVYDELAFGPRQLGLAESRGSNNASRITLDLSESWTPERSHSLPSFWWRKKLVAIASVLTMNPSLLLFDDPLTASRQNTRSWLSPCCKN